MVYDIVIIGGGSGGYAAAIRAAQLGQSVAVIERDTMGGACLNWGCIPTKTLHGNAEMINLIKHADRYGIKTEGFELDVAGIQGRKSEVIHNLLEDINRMMTRYQIPLIKGTGELITEKQIQVTLEDGRKKIIDAKNIIIATGSTPVVPPLEGIMLGGVYTSNEMLLFNDIPDELVIVGAGVVGMEFASIFQAFGSKVKVISTADRILDRIDLDVSKRLAKRFTALGGEIIANARAEKFTYDETTKKTTAWVKINDALQPVSGDVVLLSIGRKPFTTGLGIENLGIATERGGILVDENYETNIAGIYAIGDVNRLAMLAYTAANQGVRVVERIANIKSRHVKDVFASCIFVFPELAFVGLNEEEAKEQGISYKVAKYYFQNNGRALALDHTEGFIKVLCDQDEKLIGVHILGPHATDLIHEAVLALTYEMTVDDIVNTIHAHPTLSEAFREAVVSLKYGK